MPDPFHFDLVSPERLLMSEDVEEVIVPGSDGQFTVFIGHAPFMTTLKPGVLRVTRSGKEDRIFIRRGFADVSAGGLTVLAEQAIPLAELDANVIAQHIREAEEDAANAKDEAAKVAATLTLNQLKEVQAEIGR